MGSSMTELLWKIPACELQRRYRDGSLSPLAVAQACLERLEAVNPRLNAVVARRDERFLEEAAAATRRHEQGQALSALDGIPITVKDSLLTSDLPTTWGTAALRDHCTGHDEFAVARARAGGALIIGKTNVPEFALEGYTDNPLFGVTGNPWAPELTPGGSSGGAVAAVAAGIAPLAIGQDGGGSIRRPASHAGVVGLKPSLSAWPRQHVLPSLLLDFEVIGPLARTVADARLLFDALRGPATVDRSSLAAAQAATRGAAKRAAADPVCRASGRQPAGPADRRQRGACRRIVRSPRSSRRRRRASARSRLLRRGVAADRPDRPGEHVRSAPGLGRPGFARNTVRWPRRAAACRRPGCCRSSSG